MAKALSMLTASWRLFLAEIECKVDQLAGEQSVEVIVERERELNFVEYIGVVVGSHGKCGLG